MKHFNKLCLALYFASSYASLAQAATYVVTNQDPFAVGGFFEMLAATQSGDTVTFDESFTYYELYFNETLKFDKAVHIDASSLTYGLSISSLETYPFIQAVMSIDTGHDKRALKITNAFFSGAAQVPVIQVSNSNFICSFCIFLHNRNPFGSAGIESHNANVALLNTSFSGNLGSNGVLYSGDGNLYFINSIAYDNFADYPGGAMFQGNGDNQRFYVRNSTVTQNIGSAFELNRGTESTAKLNLRHTVVTENVPLFESERFAISAHVVSHGYNLLGSLSPDGSFLGKSSDLVDVDTLDVFVDVNSDGQISAADVVNPPGVNTVLYLPTIALRTDGLAYNQGDPNFSPYETFLDFRNIPAAFLLPIFNSLRNGDLYGYGRTRVADGRIDIGGYEMVSE